MPTGSTFNVIYLGNFADLDAPAGTTGAYVDVDSGYTGTESNADLLLGTYDHKDMQVVEMTAYHRAEDTLIGIDEYPSSFFNNGQEGVEYTVVGGNSVGDGIANQTTTAAGTPPPDYNNGTTGGIAIDNDVYYNAIVSYLDPVSGAITSVTKRVAVSQTDNGDVFLQEYANSNAGIHNLDGLQISEIELTSVWIGDADAVVYDIWTADGVGIIVCFGRGTQIDTADGIVAVEDLDAGTRVITKDHGLQEVRWSKGRKLTAQDLADNPNLRPIRICKGALGHNLPERDLIVSPQHSILVSSKISERMFDGAEVLVAAKQLCEIDGIDVADDLTEIECFHFLFDRHEIVVSNGVETESLYPGSEALKSVGSEGRTEIFKIFPMLRARGFTLPSARPIAKGRKGRKLAVRHAQKHKPLVAHLA